MLQSVVANATNSGYSNYFNTKIKNKIGMNGSWIPFGDNNIYWSTTRSMARFGLLILNNGVWDGTPVLNDTSYFNAMTSPLQSINNSYGYLWWLNGKSSFMVPQSQTVFSGSLIPNAPTDMFAGLGANDQKLYVIPSKNMVVIRMGQTAGGTQFASSGFDNVLWSKINAVIN